MKGTDAGLAGTLFKTAIKRDWGRRLSVDNSDRRRGGMVDIRDCLECLVRDRQVTRGTNVVEGVGTRPFVGGGTTRESTRRGGGGRSRVAGDGVGSRPSCLRKQGQGTHRTEVEELRMAGTCLALPAALEIAAAGNEQPRQDNREDG